MPSVSRLLHLLPPETAHRFTLLALKCGLGPSAAGKDDPVLHTRVWGLDFPNPVGIAAGFDKNAEAVLPLLKAGFGFVEAGTVTPQAQPGNPQPRLFRLPEQKAVINRLGFNNEGLEAYVARLKALANDPFRQKSVVGANLGRNKDQTDAAADYVTGVRAVSKLADYVVINISSPNTPGLRGLQNKPELSALLAEVQKARRTLASPKLPPLLVKIASDLDEAALNNIAEVTLANKVDGLIIGNTTLSRPSGLPPALAQEAGGLSGPPLFSLSNQALRQMYKIIEGKLLLIGVGGIASAEDAYEKIRLGASLVQLYTGLIYGEPELLADIKRGLATLLRRDGFKSVADAVGTAR
ncbi:MAG: quinone-dependent dihydroorotate dehydrogenase [Proteobacteria bacterium]|nr:quinone-dependent dihydroorotate dehydrogenase [Pseudomonadota bacterium]